MTGQSPKRWRLRVSQRGGQAQGRLRQAGWPVAQAAAAAAAAWYLAHTVLDHPQPFFAPIAAAVSLSATNRQRGRRAVQMIFGVCLGIGVAELLRLALGDTAISLGVVTFVAMSLAVLAGAGFVGTGMMFVNQAAASAILVIALHRTGTASERLIDALVGGGVALAFSQLLFPPDPCRLLREAERDLLDTLAARVGELLEMLGQDQGVEEMWLVGVSQSVHAELGALAQARSSARNVARVTRHRRVRGEVSAEDRRAAHLDLLGSDVLSLLRVVGGHGQDEWPPLSAGQSQAVAGLAESLRALGDRRLPDQAKALAAQAVHLARGPAQDSPRGALIASLVGAAAEDVGRVAGDAGSPHASELGPAQDTTT